MERKQDGGAQTPEILREELPMQRFEGQKTSQAVVEGEVALPGGLREETRVLCSEAMAVLEQTDVQPGRVDAEGKVTFHVLYTQGDPTLVSALEASAEFTHSVDFPGAEDGMAAVLSLSVEHVEASAQGGRLHLMAILKAQTRLFSDEPLSVVTGVHGAEGLMLKTETLSCLSAAASGTREVLVREECELADVLQIADTLYATAFATVQDVMGGEEKATVSGNILLEVVHRSQMPSRPVVVTRHTLPFEETVPLLGENGDSLCCDAVVKDVAVLSQEGTGEGERTLRAEVLLGLTVRATASRDVCLMLDAYTTQGDLLEPVTQPVQRALKHHQLHTAESGKMTMLLDGQPPARTPLRASLRPIVTDVSRSGGKLNVEGMMEVTLLYMTDDSDVPQTYQTEEPFRMSYTCELCCQDSLQLTPSNIELTGITSDRVEVKYILHLSCYDVLLGDEPLVTDVTEQPAQPAEPGILLCFSQAGEDVWDIAKRYRVSCDSLKRMNPDLQDGVAGQQGILWHRQG